MRCTAKKKQLHQEKSIAKGQGLSPEGKKRGAFFSYALILKGEPVHRIQNAVYRGGGGTQRMILHGGTLHSECRVQGVAEADIFSDMLRLMS